MTTVLIQDWPFLVPAGGLPRGSDPAMSASRAWAGRLSSLDASRPT